MNTGHASQDEDWF